MPRPGYATITVDEKDGRRLIQTAELIVGDPSKIFDMSARQALTIVLDYVEKNHQDPEEEG